MNRAELRQFTRDLTLTQDHEVPDTLIDTFLQEAYFKVNTRRRDWSWLLQPPEQFASSTNPYDMENFGVHPVAAIADLAPAETNQLPLHQITRSEHTFMLRTRPIGNITKFYWVEGQLLYFDPVPEVDALFDVSYYADPGWAPGDTEVPTIPESFHTTTIGNYAVHRVWERQEDFDRSDAYLGRYEVGMEDLGRYENLKNRDRPKVFGELVGSKGRARNMPFLDGV